MKKIILVSLLMVFTFSSCSAQKNNISITKNNGKTTFSIQDGKKKFNLKLKGEVTFTDDERGIKSLSSDGRISYKKGKKKLKVIPEKNGVLLYNINGTQKTELEPKDQTLIAECVQMMIDTGVNGKERAQKIYDEKGFDGVLKEVDRFDSDYVKSIYLRSLGAYHSLSDNEMIAFLKKADTRLSSDYYKAELLNGIRENYLRNEITANAYLKTVKNLKSDYYQAETLQKLLKTPLSKEQSEQVLHIVNTMDSDHYKSEIIQNLLRDSDISDTQYNQLINMVGAIKSDYYQSKLLSSLLKNKSIQDKRFTPTLSAIQHMKSSYYQAVVLKHLIGNRVDNKEEWSQLIHYTQKIDSDYYKAEVLKKIAKNMPTSDTLKKEFEEAAKTIHSDLYYGRVMRKVHNNAFTR